MTAPRRRWSFGLGTLFVLVTLACWFSYQLNWIRERHRMVAEEEAVSSALGNYATGVTSDTLAPVNSAASRIVLAVFGEARVERILVYYIVDESSREKTAEDFPKIKRAQRLFPEATIIAVWVTPEEVQFERELMRIDLTRMISE